MKRARFSLVLALAVAACGGSFVDRANQTLSTALAATNAAKEAFVDWDERTQLQIVDNAATREGAERRLAAYRAARQKVVVAFSVAYSSLSAAAAVLPLIESGVRKEVDVLGLIEQAVAAAIHVRDAVSEIRDSFSDEPNAQPAGDAEAAGIGLAKPPPEPSSAGDDPVSAPGP